MAMDFNVNVDIQTNGQSKLDAIENQIKTIKSMSPIDIKFNVSGFDVTKYQQLFGQLGQQAGRNFSKNLTTAISQTNISNVLSRMTMKGADKTLTDNVKKHLENVAKSGLQIKDVVGSLDKNGIVSLKITGLDSMGTAITLIDKLDSKTNKLKSSTNFKINLDNGSINSFRQMSNELNRFEDKFRNLSFDAQFAKMNSQLSRFSGQSSASLTNATRELQEYQNALNQLNRHYNQNDSFTLNQTDLMNTYRRLNDSAERFKNTMSIVNTETSRSITSLEANASANKVAAYYEKNSKAVKKYGDALKQLESQYRSATTIGQKTDLDRQFASLKSQISAEGLTGTSKLAEMKRAFTQIGQFVGIYGLLQSVVMRVPAEMVQAVKDINAAQIDLQKVSSASTSELASYYDRAINSAQKYGSTISDIIQSTADWSRLGYGIKEAEQLANATTLMQKVGDNMTQQSSSEGLISTLRGFSMQADEVTSIIDKVNEVANTQPIDTSGLFEALSRSSSSMSAANNTLSESIALITAANSVVQDPSTIGTAFKTISMRIRGSHIMCQSIVKTIVYSSIKKVA